MRRSFRTLLHMFSFLVVLTAVFAFGRQDSVAYAADRMYTFNMGFDGMQGSLILVESNGQWGLMDGGHRYTDTIQDSNGRVIPLPASDQYSSQISMRNGRDVAQYMVNVLGVRHLDFVVGTHSHMDHIGGIPEIATTGFYDAGGNYRYLVDNNTTYFYKQYQHISDIEDDLVQYSDLSWHNQAFYYQATKTMQDMGANMVEVSSQQVIQGDPGNAYGDYITFTMGNMSFRLYNLYEQTNTGGENVNSIVTVMTNGNYTVVNLADIDIDNGAIDRTSEAIGKDFGAVDVVVAGHHGYEGSNTKIMFDELQPDYVVISNDRGQNSWLYTKNDLAVAMPYAKKMYGTNFYSTALSPYAVVTDMSGSKVYVYSINGKGNLTDIMKKMIKPTKGTGWVSWLNTDGVIWAYLENGNTVKNAWRQVKGKWYHFDRTGLMQTGWLKSGGNMYYLDPTTGARKSGWLEYDGQWYYLSKNGDYGKMLTGWQTVKGKRYYFYKDGTMASNTWVKGRYLTADGAMQTGWREENGLWYYMNPNKNSGDWGKTMTGWQNIKKQRYYFYKDGHMAADAWVGGRYLTPEGPMKTGWFQQDGRWYYLDKNNDNGKYVTSWKDIKKQRYYFYKDGHMAADEWVKGRYLTPEGPMKTGWFQQDGRWYYLDKNNDNGKYVTGWKDIKKQRYYFYKDGHMAMDEWVGGRYLTPDGHMALGWQQIGGSWYFLKKDGGDDRGKPMKGWQTISKNKYYFYKDGRMASDTWVDGYYMTPSGPQGYGWQNTGGSWYYLDTNKKSKGYGKPLTGWQQLDGAWYFFCDDGRMAANTFVEGYFLGADGRIGSGWQTVGSDRYYISAEGHALTGRQTIDGTAYDFGSDGRLIVPAQSASAAQTAELDSVQAASADPAAAENPEQQSGLMAASALSSAVPPSAGWFDRENGRVYLDEEGRMQLGWLNLDGQSYYLNDFDEESPQYGTILTGWVTLADGVQYYFDPTDGHRVLDGWADGRYLDQNGQIAAGWLDVGGERYFLNLDASNQENYGRPLTGRQTIGGVDYTFDEVTGALLTDKTEGEGAGGGQMLMMSAPPSDGKDPPVLFAQKNVVLQDTPMMKSVESLDDPDPDSDLDPDPDPDPDPNPRKNGFVTGDDGSTYYYVDDVPTTSDWQTVDGARYYFDADGVMQTGWQQLDDSWFFFNSDGVMQTGWQDLEEASRYYFAESGGLRAVLRTLDDASSSYQDKDGTPLSGWLTLDDGTHYVLDGVMQTGWLTLDGGSCYLNDAGIRVTGWQTLEEGSRHWFTSDGFLAYVFRTGDSGICCFDKNDAAQTGWLQLGDAWYYCGEGGSVCTGFLTDGGATYYLADDGVMVQGEWQKIGDCWYYFGSTGAMQTGWQKIDGDWYYFYGDGHLAISETTPDGYYVDANGIWKE